MANKVYNTLVFCSLKHIIKSLHQFLSVSLQFRIQKALVKTCNLFVNSVFYDNQQNGVDSLAFI